MTSSGLYLGSSQEPFDDSGAEGDYSYRELPTPLSREDVSVSHGHYDPAAALADPNCVFPAERMAELAGAGVIAAVAPAGYSFLGFATDARRFVESVAVIWGANWHPFRGASWHRLSRGHIAAAPNRGIATPT